MEIDRCDIAPKKRVSEAVLPAQISPLIVTAKSPRRRFDRLHEVAREQQAGRVRLRAGHVLTVHRRRGDLLWLPSPFMAITRTALGVSANKVGADITFSVAGILTVGNTLVCITVADAATGGVLLRAADTTLLGTFTNRVSAATDVICSIWELVNLTSTQVSNADLVRRTGGGTATAGACIELGGVASDPFDKTSSGIGTGLAATSGATATTAQADEILIGAIGWEGPVEDQDGTWQNSFSAGQQAGTTGGGAASNITVDEGYLIVSATGAYTGALTRTLDGRDWAAAIATYKAATASAIKPLPRSFVPIMRSANY